MTKLMSFLDGKKTFSLAFLAACTVLAQLSGLLDEKTSTTLLTLLGFGSAVTLRSGMKK